MAISPSPPPPFPYSFTFISVSVPWAHIIPFSRLAAPWNTSWWNWAILAGHQGVTVKENSCELSFSVNVFIWVGRQCRWTISKHLYNQTVSENWSIASSNNSLSSLWDWIVNGFLYSIFHVNTFLFLVNIYIFSWFPYRISSFSNIF